MQPPTPHNIVEASAQVAALPATRAVDLGSGRSATIRRLSWLEFEALWGGIAALLDALAQAPPAPETADDAKPGAVGLGESGLAASGAVQALAGAPALALQLASLASGIPEGELARWPWDDVLAVATAALKLNFIESAGVRDFFLAVSRLSPSRDGVDG